MRTPIDFFFRTLAEDRQEWAIGIILSGTVGREGSISPTDATLKADVITAGEEHVIARETASCVARMKNALRE